MQPFENNLIPTIDLTQEVQSFVTPNLPAVRIPFPSSSFPQPTSLNKQRVNIVNAQPVDVTSNDYAELFRKENVQVFEGLSQFLPPSEAKRLLFKLISVAGINLKNAENIFVFHPTEKQKDILKLILSRFLMAKQIINPIVNDPSNLQINHIITSTDYENLPYLFVLDFSAALKFVSLCHFQNIGQQALQSKKWLSLKDSETSEQCSLIEVVVSQICRRIKEGNLTEEEKELSFKFLNLLFNLQVRPDFYTEPFLNHLKDIGSSSDDWKQWMKQVLPLPFYKQLFPMEPITQVDSNSSANPQPKKRKVKGSRQKETYALFSTLPKSAISSLIATYQARIATYHTKDNVGEIFSNFSTQTHGTNEKPAISSLTAHLFANSQPQQNTTIPLNAIYSNLRFYERVEAQKLYRSLIQSIFTNWNDIQVKDKLLRILAKAGGQRCFNLSLVRKEDSELDLDGLKVFLKPFYSFYSQNSGKSDLSNSILLHAISICRFTFSLEQKEQFAYSLHSLYNDSPFVELILQALQHSCALNLIAPLNFEEEENHELLGIRDLLYAYTLKELKVHANALDEAMTSIIPVISSASTSQKEVFFIYRDSNSIRLYPISACLENPSLRLLAITRDGLLSSLKKLGSILFNNIGAFLNHAEAAIELSQEQMEKLIGFYQETPTNFYLLTSPPNYAMYAFISETATERKDSLSQVTHFSNDVNNNNNNRKAFTFTDASTWSDGDSTNENESTKKINKRKREKDTSSGIQLYPLVNTPMDSFGGLTIFESLLLEFCSHASVKLKQVHHY